VTSAPPHLAYYRAHQGRWSAPYSVSITSWRAFWTAPMGPLDRLRGLWMGTVAAWTGLRMDTSVDCEVYAARREVLHTTALSLWGVTFFRSVEVLALREDGLGASMSGEQRLWPVPWRPRPFGEGQVEIAPDAQSARYTFDWMGGRLVQRTRVVPEGLELEQQTDWFRARALLRRY
jgi:hypothetical protein